MPQTCEGQLWAHRGWSCSCPWSNLAVTSQGRGARNQHLLPDPCVVWPLSDLPPQNNTFPIKAQSVLRHHLNCSKNKSHRIGVYLRKFLPKFCRILQILGRCQLLHHLVLNALAVQGPSSAEGEQHSSRDWGFLMLLFLFFKGLWYLQLRVNR